MGFALTDQSGNVIDTYRTLPTRIMIPGTQRVLAMGDDLTGWTDGDHALVAHDIAAPAPTLGDIANERSRRLALGFNYDFGDSRGVHRIGTTDADLKGWDEVSTYAGALIDSGDITTHIAIVTDTGPCAVTAPEWRAIEIEAARFRQPLWAKSFALMASNPIPADFKNDSYWS